MAVYQRRELLRGDDSLYSLSGKRDMSFNHWSRHELMHTECTDHWSKLRCKSYRLTKLPTGNYINFCKPQDSWAQRFSREKLGLSKATMVTPEGTLAPVGNPQFNIYLNERLHNPHLVRPKPPLDSRGYDRDKVRAPTACSMRAKLGYKYWLEDNALKTKAAKSGAKVTLGSQGTFLGIGVPRV